MSGAVNKSPFSLNENSSFPIHGFELMLNKEGPKNLFRVLQCRDVDMDSLQGILVDPYILNREAEMLQWKLFLVDRAHWNGMKKLKKADRSGKNGHLG